MATNSALNYQPLGQALPPQPFKAAKPITPADLNQDANPINVPPRKPATQSDALLGYIGASADTYNQQLAQNTEEARKPLAGLSSQIAKALQAPGETQLTDQAYNEAGVDAAQSELNDINSQLLSEQRALELELRALEKNPEGLFGGALQDKMEQVKTESLQRQADLSIIAMARQGKVDLATKIADRAIRAQLESQKNKLQTLQFLYSENKEMFSKAEQRQFESVQADRERALANEEYRLRAEFDQKIKQSDPMYQAQLRETEARAAKLEAEGIPSVVTPQALAYQQSTINDTASLLTHSGLAGAVGPNDLARLSPISSFTGSKQSFISGIEQIRSQLTLDKLQQAKANGATFGALSDGERQTLAAAATKIGTWAITKDGQVIGYNVNEADFKRELDRINNFSKLDFILKGGDPSTVGVFETKDGRLWTRNSDNSYTELK